MTAPAFGQRATAVVACSRCFQPVIRAKTTWGALLFIEVTPVLVGGDKLLYFYADADGAPIDDDQLVAGPDDEVWKSAAAAELLPAMRWVRHGCDPRSSRGRR